MMSAQATEPGYAKKDTDSPHGHIERGKERSYYVEETEILKD